VPVGSFKKTPLNEITINDAWEGAMIDKVSNLNSYMHFRPVQTKEKKSLSDRK